MQCTFDLTNREFIELCNLLKSVGACETGGQAKIEISDRRVKVDGIVETRKRCKIRKGQEVEFEEYLIKVI